MQREHLFAGVFLLSVSVLIFEITLIRWLSVVVPSNLAFLGVTFALFGVAFGGVLVYSLQQHYKLDKFRTQLAWYCFLYGVALVAFIILVIGGTIYLVSLVFIKATSNPDIQTSSAG